MKSIEIEIQPARLRYIDPGMCQPGTVVRYKEGVYGLLIRSREGTDVLILDENGPPHLVEKEQHWVGQIIGELDVLKLYCTYFPDKSCHCAPSEEHERDTET